MSERGWSGGDCWKGRTEGGGESGGDWRGRRKGCSASSLFVVLSFSSCGLIVVASFRVLLACPRRALLPCPPSVSSSCPPSVSSSCPPSVSSLCPPSVLSSFGRRCRRWASVRVRFGAFVVVWVVWVVVGTGRRVVVGVGLALVQWATWWWNIRRRRTMTEVIICRLVATSPGGDVAPSSAVKNELGGTGSGQELLT